MVALDWFFDEWRRSGGEQFIPRVHGNGFIQVDLDAAHRLHLFGVPSIPRQGIASTIHDHVWGFHSRVLRGRIVNLIYNVVHWWHEADADYHVHVAHPARGSDTKLENTGYRVCAFVKHSDTTVCLPNDGGYAMEPFVFHETIASEPTLTLIEKRQRFAGVPRVLVPINAQPDNAFDRHSFDAAALWALLLKHGSGIEVPL